MYYYYQPEPMWFPNYDEARNAPPRPPPRPDSSGGHRSRTRVTAQRPSHQPVPVGPPPGAVMMPMPMDDGFSLRRDTISKLVRHGGRILASMRPLPDSPPPSAEAEVNARNEAEHRRSIAEWGQKNQQLVAFTDALAEAVEVL